jgi:quercetin dioxygenase-like cupin family protein
MITNSHLWGESWDIYRDKQVWVVGFRGRAADQSSTHYHKGMSHSVAVLSGLMVIQYGENSFVPICPGEVCGCSANEVHRLIFQEDTEGIETYYSLPGHEIDPNDIVRLSPGKAPE